MIIIQNFGIKFLRVSFRQYSYKSLKYGKSKSDSFKLYLENNGKIISPFHDIPLYHDQNQMIFNMIIEIPKFTNAKMEISKNNQLNPIMYDLRNGVVRNIKNIFPYHGYIWNYGALPQTWENPFKLNDVTNIAGDNDPLDACEIGSDIFETGSIIQVKLIGLLGMIDQGEMDWKLIVINTKDRLCEKLQGLEDVEAVMPGLLNATRHWYRYYKVPDGKSETKFAFDGRFRDKEFSLGIINETHEAWQSLVSGKKTDIQCSNSTIVGSPHNISQEDCRRLLASEQRFEESDVPDQKDGQWYHYV